ncbi:MAG: hypothetical protein ACI8UX_000121, partial [Psychromonas sp.]
RSSILSSTKTEFSTFSLWPSGQFHLINNIESAILKHANGFIKQ